MKIGDRVKVVSNGSSLIGREGVIQNLRFEDGISVLLDEDKHKLGADVGCWNLYFEFEEVEVVNV